MVDVLAQFLSYALAAWRRRAYAIVTAWLVAMAGWAAVATLPDIYKSSAVVHVDTASILQPLLGDLAIDLDSLAEIDLVQRTLLSRPNLERVLRGTDLDLKAQDQSEMERLIQDVTGRIEVGRQANGIFAISFEDSDPQLAHDVVQELLTIFVESNLGGSREDLDTARRFIDEQIRLYEERLTEAERKIAEFKQQRLGLLPGQAYQPTSFNDAQRAVVQAEDDLRNARVRRDALQRELQQVPQFFPTQSAFGSGPPTDTAAQIMAVQGTLDDLRSRFTDKHPDVIVAERRLKALLEMRDKEIQALATTNEMAQQEDLPKNETGVPNPIYEQIKIQLVQEEANIATLSDRAEQARKIAESAREWAARGADLEAEFARMNRDHDLLLGRYQQLLSSRETEQLSRARDTQAETVRFRVMEPPKVPAVPSGPQRLLLLAAVLLVSIGSGGGVAVLLALSSETFSSVAELRAAVAVPVLGSVSTGEFARRGIWTQSKSAIFWTALIALFAVFAALWFIELRVGLNNFLPDDLMSTGPASLLRRLPFI